MPKLLIINGHDTYESSPGHLNQTMVEVMREELKDKFEIQISVLKDGYETEEEANFWKPTSSFTRCRFFGLRLRLC